MAPTLNLRDLQLLVAIAEEGGVTRAGARLHLTQSALSHHLKDTEQRIGAPLFLRIGKRMVLTPAGERLLAFGRRVMKDFDDVEQEVRNLGESKAGTIRVSARCSTCYHWLPGILRDLRQQFPQIGLSIRPENQADPLRGLRQGALDLAIVSSVTKDKDLRLVPLFTDEMLVVLNKGHRLAHGRVVMPKQLDGETVVVYPPREESFLLNRLMAPARAQPADVIEIPLTEAIVELVQAGIGVSLLADWAAAPYVRAGKVVAKRITAAGFHRQWHAALLRRQPVARHLQEFIRLLQAYQPR